MPGILYAANWKMHLGPAGASEYLRQFLPRVAPSAGRDLWFFPPAVSLSVVAEACRGRPDVVVGAQDAHWEPKGAFTGAISMAMVRESGGQAVLVGHSERRHVFGESDEETGRKVRAALDAGLAPLLCVGEKLAERDAGRTAAVVVRQLEAGLGQAGAQDRMFRRHASSESPEDSIGRWKRELDPAEAELFAAEIGPELRMLGFEA